MSVRNFLEFERSLQGDGIVNAAPEVKKFLRMELSLGELISKISCRVRKTTIDRFRKLQEPLRIKSASGFVVDLIGAVHVGEKSYYEALDKQFEDYDAVLYELVAPEGTRVPKGSKPGGHPSIFAERHEGFAGIGAPARVH